MKDMRVHSEKLRTDAAECDRIRDSAADPKKRELFMRLGQHLRVLADEIDSAIAQIGDKDIDV
jgi:hypothetical protein